MLRPMTGDEIERWLEPGTDPEAHRIADLYGGTFLYTEADANYLGFTLPDVGDFGTEVDDLETAQRLLARLDLMVASGLSVLQALPEVGLREL